MNTTIQPPAAAAADRYANAIMKANENLAAAKKARLDAHKRLDEAFEFESAAAGRVAVAIAEAIRNGADAASVLPFEMLQAQRVTRIITSAAELTIKRLGNSLCITGSRFPGWMEVVVSDLFVHYMPAPGRSLPKAPVGVRPVAEMNTWLGRLLNRFRARRQHIDALDVRIALDINSDIAGAQVVAGRLAYTAEQADREAARLIRETLADGRIDIAEIPVLRNALKNIERSADKDHDITEALS